MTTKTKDQPGIHAAEVVDMDTPGIRYPKPKPVAEAVGASVVDEYVGLLARSLNGEASLTPDDERRLADLSVAIHGVEPVTCPHCHNRVKPADNASRVERDRIALADYAERLRKSKAAEEHKQAAEQAMADSEAKIEEAAMKGGDTAYFERQRDTALIRLSTSSDAAARASTDIALPLFGERIRTLCEAYRRIHAGTLC